MSAQQTLRDCLCFVYAPSVYYSLYVHNAAYGNVIQIGANSNDERAEEAVRRSQGSNPTLDIAFRRGGEAMEGSGAPPGVGIGGGSAGGPGAAASWQTQ